MAETPLKFNINPLHHTVAGLNIERIILDQEFHERMDVTG
jgi:hypothetical protein